MLLKWELEIGSCVFGVGFYSSMETFRTLQGLKLKQYRQF